jgi:hypothetical protein
LGLSLLCLLDEKTLDLVLWGDALVEEYYSVYSGTLFIQCGSAILFIILNTFLCMLITLTEKTLTSKAVAKK